MFSTPFEVALFLIGVPKEDMALTKKLSDHTSMLVNSPLPEEQQVEYARDFLDSNTILYSSSTSEEVVLEKI